MTNDTPNDLVEPFEPEYQVQHMTDEFEVWNTLETYDNIGDAKQHAQAYADGNPDAEVQIVKVARYNY